MTQQLTILTGASRGMGLAMARQLLTPGNTVLGIARTAQEALTLHAGRTGATFIQWALDLADGAEASARLERWLNQQDSKTWSSATLINNAGVIPEIAPLSQSDAGELARTLRVGLEAPMQLTSAFLRATEGWFVQRKVLNISSGLGRRAMASQAAYCAAKAGMDHFTRCLALDEALKAHPAKVCSLAPGVIDTDMQAQLRGASRTAFPDQENFLRMKNEGQLSSPEAAASRVLAYLGRPDFGDEPVADIRD